MDIELTTQEQSIIESALNAYFNDAHLTLENNGVFMGDGRKRPLGDIEKKLLEVRIELILPVLRKFENLM